MTAWPVGIPDYDASPFASWLAVRGIDAAVLTSAQLDAYRAEFNQLLIERGNAQQREVAMNETND